MHSITCLPVTCLPVRHGKGVALVMQGTAIPNLDMGAASIKMNDDGSFNLLVGATDLGTGSDTVLTQMAAEVLGCPPEDFITYSSDTDFTPFDVGAYASSTTYISGAAVVEAARKVAEQIKAVAGQILDAPAEEIMLADRQAWAPDGRSVTLAEIALHSLHKTGQHQIMAVGSYVSPDSPPPFAAQFADVTVDTATGQVTVNKLVMVLDCGMIVNPAAAVGQIEGGMTQALGYAVCEEMLFDERGRLVNPRFGDYRIFTADEMPEMVVRFVQTYEPTHPFGVKAVAEIPLDGVGPAVANAVYNATGVQIPVIPLTPERVWRALQQASAVSSDTSRSLADDFVLKEVPMKHRLSFPILRVDPAEPGRIAWSGRRGQHCAAPPIPPVQDPDGVFVVRVYYDTVEDSGRPDQTSMSSNTTIPRKKYCPGRGG